MNFTPCGISEDTAYGQPALKVHGKLLATANSVAVFGLLP
jgi:hypothetical protein